MRACASGRQAHWGGLTPDRCDLERNRCLACPKNDVRVEHHVADAIEKGGLVRCGGHRRHGSTFRTGRVDQHHPDMAVACEETFGLLAAIIRLDDADDVVRQANDTIYGLAAYFFASDHKRVWRVAEALESGMVGIHTGRMSSEAPPFGTRSSPELGAKDRATGSTSTWR